LLKRLLLLLLAPLVGAVAGFGLAYVFENGWLWGWQPVAPPPEAATALHALSGPNLWVEAASGQLYHNAAADTCATGCWAPVADVVKPPLDDDTREVRPTTCVRPPPLLFGAEQTLAECRVEQWVDFNTVYALRGDGSLRVWRFTSGGEWVGLTFILLPLLGAAAFFLLALALVVVLAIAAWLRRRSAA
jgi:hypothetical protein